MAEQLSDDAMIFGFAYLSGPNATLSFGGEGAASEITPRARAALDELIAKGFAVASEPTTSIPGREYYRGTDAGLRQIVGAAKLDIFSPAHRWTTFAKKGAAHGMAGIENPSPEARRKAAGLQRQRAQQENRG